MTAVLTGKSNFHSLKMMTRSLAMDLFSFVCLLSHCRPCDGALENHFFQIQYLRVNEWIIFRYTKEKFPREHRMICSGQFTYVAKENYSTWQWLLDHHRLPSLLLQFPTSILIGCPYNCFGDPVQKLHLYIRETHHKAYVLQEILHKL